MQTFTDDFKGTDGGPPSTDAYKRAVYKQPPRYFAVQVLPPQKFGNAYSYGLLISPLRDGHDRQSIISGSSSGSSSGSQTTTAMTAPVDTSTTAPLSSEYEVWRRWEDCLYFQDLLEVQYGKMAREKRARLLAGKGVKKNGMYAHQDPARGLHRAASFESLPPGPDPNMIAKDVHQVLPGLTKKGTLFRPSKETIEQRGQEFKALIEALLDEGDDVPALIRELRQLRVVRDFFGFWRRDQDRIEKQYGVSLNGDRFSVRSRSDSLGSRASSVFSGSGRLGTGLYFNPSNLSLQPPTPIAPESSPTNKSPRRPAFMQGGKGAMNLVPPSHNSENATPRRRAQTLQANSSASAGMRFSPSVDEPSVDLQNPPASAPACYTFAEAMDSGYNSDPAYPSRTPISPQTFPTTPQTSHTLTSAASPRSFRTMRSPRGQMEIRYSDIFLSNDNNEPRKNVGGDKGGPTIVGLGENGLLPFDDDDESVASRENRYFVTQSIESRMGGLHHLQNLTIKEEDEGEFDDGQHNGLPYYSAQSDFQPSGSSVGHGTSEYAEGFESLSPSGTDRKTIADGRTINDPVYPKSPSWSFYSTPASTARIAAAHADALRALTGGRPLTPMSASNPAPWDAPSIRSSVLTTTSGSGSGSASTDGSTNSGHAHSSDTQSSVDMRPYSYQSSTASCEDIDDKLSSSPIILHSPLLEDDDADSGYLTDRRQNSYTSGYRPHDSISSVRTFMTESSVDMVIPPREHRPVPPRAAAASSNGLWPEGANGASLSRSHSSDSRSPTRMNQMSSANEPRNEEDGVELRDSFFYASPSKESVEGRTNGSRPPGQSNGYSRPLQNGTIDQSTSPWAQQRPMSPPTGFNPRDSARSIDTSVSVSASVASSNPDQSASSYAPSIMSSLSEDLGTSPVSIKVVCGDNIVAFRIDRNSALPEVREKLRHKLVDQQGVQLAEHFTLAYKPPGPGRVQELRKAFGRVRSSSVSSAGSTDPGSLRGLFSQRDWLDAVGSCSPGAKVTLHVLNG